MDNDRDLPATAADLRHRLEKIDQRLDAIQNATAPGGDAKFVGLGTGRSLSPAEGALLSAEASQLADMRGTIVATLAAVEELAAVEVEKYRRHRAKVIAGAEATFGKVADIARQFDQAVQQAAALLAERAKLVESLAPILGGDAVNRLVKVMSGPEAAINRALGDALRRAPSHSVGDRQSLASHDERAIVAAGRNRIAEHKAAEAAEAERQGRAA